MPQLRALAVVRSGRQLLGVAWGGLHDLSADLTADCVENRDGVAALIIADAPIVRLLLPIGARRVALDLPFAVPHGTGRRLVERGAIRSPIYRSLAGLSGCGRCGGLQI